MEASDLARKTEEKAFSQNGVLENPIGSNSGPEVNEYLTCVHADPGKAWCSAFACWCVQQASIELGITHKLKFSASALHLWSNNPDLQIQDIKSTDLPCIGIYDHGQGLGHVVIFIGLDESTGQLTSIAGNTNQAASRNGIGVFVLSDRYNKSDSNLVGGLRIV